MGKKKESATASTYERAMETSDDESEDENFPSVKKKRKLNKRKKTEKEDVSSDKDSETSIPKFRTKSVACNILKYYRNFEMGLPCQRYKKPLRDSIINYCKLFKLYKVESPFNRRVTYMVWHPKNPTVISVTSHWGDVLLYDYEKDLESACLIEGIGAGGSVQGMKFDPLNPIQIYTVSMEGKFLILNFETKEATQFLETNDINRWYISLDVNVNNNLMVAGDTKGSVTILTLQGEVIDKVQLHKNNFKVSHTEFSRRESWLLCTSSTDSSIKLWDIRYLKSSKKKELAEPLQTIKHEKPINAAYFSLSDGCRLLTTDQFDKISIYRAPLWDLETVISHPHRQYQHLTPIKAYWHPLEDIIFVGRYPHVDFPGYHVDELRTLDFFDAETGELLHQHYQNGFNGILSLNRFNITGDALASSYGSHFLIWTPNFKHLQKLDFKNKLKKGDDKDSKGHFNGGGDDDDDDNDDDDNRFNGIDEDVIDVAALLKNRAKEKAKERKANKKKSGGKK